MVYLDCNNASVGEHGAECLRSCHTLDVDCVSPLSSNANPHLHLNLQGEWEGEYHWVADGFGSC